MKNVRFHSAQNYFSSYFKCKNQNTTICETIWACLKIFAVTCCLYGFEILCLIQREEHTLIVFENKLLRRIYEPKREEVAGIEKIS
jgi:hypothetical protein